MAASTKCVVFKRIAEIVLPCSNEGILPLLAHEHNVVISIRTVKCVSRRLCLFRRRNHTSLEEGVTLEQTEIASNGLMQDIDG